MGQRKLAPCWHLAWLLSSVHPRLPNACRRVGIKVIHTTEFLEKLMVEGRLPSHGSHGRRCPKTMKSRRKVPAEGYLSRSMPPRKMVRHLRSPRNILKSIPQLELVEMFFNRADAWCCGAGAGVMSLSGEYAKAIASERLNQADKTGAMALVSACPFCKYNFEQAAKGREKPWKYTTWLRWWLQPSNLVGGSRRCRAVYTRRF